ncbi:MAG: hypothetical protein B6D45_11495 [Ignavibacteriales bacterium UTCHB3]|nr:MAG: hypothetical protein B6D45_11495 [Ignavibacteriales bacterium UTCHB3]
MGVKADISKGGKTFEKDILYSRVDGKMQPDTVKIDEFGVQLLLKTINPADKSATIIVKDESGKVAPAAPKEVLSIHASIKPMINLVWVGVVVVVFGFIISMFRRFREAQN